MSQFSTANLEFAPVSSAEQSASSGVLKIIRKGTLITRADGSATESELPLGEITRGIYEGRKETTIQSGRAKGKLVASHAIREDDGSLVLMNETKALRDGFALVKEGEPVMVSYGGMLNLKNGNTFYKYVVNTATNYNG